MQDLHLQPAFGAVAQGHSLPGLGGLLLRPPIDPDRGRLRLAAGRGTTVRPRRRGDDRPGIVQVDPLVFVNIPDEALAAVVERPQQRRIAAIQTIKAHPGKADPLLAGVGDHLQCRSRGLRLKPRVCGGDCQSALKFDQGSASNFDQDQSPF
ncbi:MAG: hypothetical protein MZV65_33260 [Chromatiales bacterium]|nr:hypothetical protein [Chromatiales bacterium]